MPRLLTRTLFREIFVSAILGCVLFSSVIFLFLSNKVFEFVVRNPGPAKTVAKLFGLVMPQTLPFTIPLGVLVGVLLVLGRKSSDGEITAMRAAGVPGRRVLSAAMGFAVLGMIAAGSASLWLTPWSIRKGYSLRNELIETQLKADIQPRLFEERFPNRVVYVRDISTQAPSLWKQVLIADTKPSPERGESPELTLAQEAIAQPDLARNQIQLTLKNSTTYKANRDVPKYEINTSPNFDLPLEAHVRQEERALRPATELDTLPLYRAAYKDPNAKPEDLLESRVELHQRLALPFACIVLTFAGVPLGLSSRRRGKSPAVVLTVALAFLYYMTLIGVVGLARQKSLPVELAMWTPNILVTLLGTFLFLRLERPGTRDIVEVVTGWFRRPTQKPSEGRRLLPSLNLRRLPLLPQIINMHVATRFLFYFFLWLVSFILLLDVFTFFEVLSDMIKNKIPLATVGEYLFFLTPRWVYTLTPVSVLTSVLVVLGVMSKDNEVSAYKACGVSVYRLAFPLLLTSLMLSGALFAFNHYVVPSADRRQNALRAEIKGRPAQTFVNPGKKWIWGTEDRIFTYRYYDTKQNVMAGVNVFELDLAKFQLKRHIVAEAARWEPRLDAWVFQNGWSRDVRGSEFGKVDNFGGQTRVFAEIEETPDYFLKEKIESEQMNYKELQAYIDELRQSGFDTTALRVQYFQKFSVPLFAFILALVSVPFAFGTGNRGAMAGVGISFVIFIAYKSMAQLFEQVGSLNQLPPEIAAWSPDAVFSLAGLYFLMRIRS
jgi:LPS export ABC transporter permease LptG/LPS export ABC transporter permease LptF